MSSSTYGVVDVDEWHRIGREDEAKRARTRDRDFRGSVLTGIAGMIILAMLAIGPLWTLTALVGGPDEHGPAFDRLWLAPLALTLAAFGPLGLALRRESSRLRWLLVALLVGSLAIQVATCPWI